MSRTDAKVTKPCVQCGNTFTSWTYKNQLYCSTKCRRASQKITSRCETCGKEFTRKASRAGRYCSRACRPGRPKKPESYVTKPCPVCGKEFTYHISRPLETCSNECRRDPAKTVVTNCPECGKEFTYFASWPRKYCSRKCRAKQTTGNIKHWKPSAYKATCEQCEKVYTTTPKRTNGRFCSRECYGKWLEINAPTGPDSPNWRGGYEPYYGGNWRQQRRAARRRDRYTCRNCGITEDQLGKSLDVHHIKPFRTFNGDYKAANAMSNLISYCNKCHTTWEWPRKSG